MGSQKGRTGVKGGKLCLWSNQLLCLWICNWEEHRS